MHFLTSLIIFSGFAFVVCLGLINVIWDLSAMSVHVAPNMLATPHDGGQRSRRGTTERDCRI